MNYYKIEELAEILGKSTTTVARRLKEIYKGSYNESEVVKQGKRLLYANDVLQTLKNSWEMYDEEEEITESSAELGGELLEEEKDLMREILRSIPSSKENIHSTLQLIEETTAIKDLETVELLNIVNMSTHAMNNYCVITRIKYSILKELG